MRLLPNSSLILREKVPVYRIVSMHPFFSCKYNPSRPSLMDITAPCLNTCPLHDPSHGAPLLLALVNMQICHFAYAAQQFLSPIGRECPAYRACLYSLVQLSLAFKALWVPTVHCLLYPPRMAGSSASSRKDLFCRFRGVILASE
jgi:hypothetical protein